MSDGAISEVLTDKNKYQVDIKDLYKTLLDTRNLEISLFWRRSNYFLVLNTGIALGFFSIKEPKFSIFFVVGGFLASLLWFWVCLGGKYWQARWEQRLQDFESEHLPGLDFFAASPERIRSDVEKGFEFHKEMLCTQRFIYKLALKKPSVSYSMIRLAALFAIMWFGFLLVYFTNFSNPISSSSVGLFMKEFLEYFKFLVPIATFGLGVLATPLIESRKEKARAKSVRRNLIVEIEDELNELPKRLVKMSEVLKSLNDIRLGRLEIGKIGKYTPRSTSCYFLKSAMEVSFGLFNKDQRCAIKSLFAQIGGLDGYLFDIKNTKLSSETLDESINNCKRYLYTGSCMLNTMRIIANKPHAAPAEDDKNIIGAILLELGIELSVDDLKIISTTRF